MDLKLKDEIISLLIQKPGLSISEIAKKTDNYYSYTHRVVKELQKQGSIKVKKVSQGKRKVTVCYVSEEYKKTWIKQLKKFFSNQMKDAEIKAAFLLSYFFLIYVNVKNYLTNNQGIVQESALAVRDSFTIQASTQPQAFASQSQALDYSKIVLLLVTVLVLFYLIRKFRKERD